MSTSFGLSNIWTQGDAVTRLILIAMLTMSVLSWVVIVLKALSSCSWSSPISAKSLS